MSNTLYIELVVSYDGVDEWLEYINVFHGHNRIMQKKYHGEIKWNTDRFIHAIDMDTPYHGWKEIGDNIVHRVRHHVDDPAQFDPDELIGILRYE